MCCGDVDTAVAAVGVATTLGATVGADVAAADDDDGGVLYGNDAKSWIEDGI